MTTESNYDFLCHLLCLVWQQAHAVAKNPSYFKLVSIQQQETITRLFDCIWHWVFPWSPSQDSADSDFLKTTFDNPYWVLIFLIPRAILDIFMSLQRIFTKRALSALRTIRGCFLFLFFSFSCNWCRSCSWLVRDVWGRGLLSLLSFPFIWSGGFNWLGRYCKKKIE